MRLLEHHVHSVALELDALVQEVTLMLRLLGAAAAKSRQWHSCSRGIMPHSEDSNGRSQAPHGTTAANSSEASNGSKATNGSEHDPLPGNGPAPSPEASSNGSEMDISEHKAALHSSPEGSNGTSTLPQRAQMAVASTMMKAAAVGRSRNTAADGAESSQPPQQLRSQAGTQEADRSNLGLNDMKLSGRQQHDHLQVIDALVEDLRFPADFEAISPEEEQHLVLTAVAHQSKMLHLFHAFAPQSVLNFLQHARAFNQHISNAENSASGR